ncbi:MAG: hypothetical protein CM15mV4_3030 [Caudoviricetes sp.]|nr:MAG: hypothetical protein CM15mV4_3030 [Caudoviricetes sp.]
MDLISELICLNLLDFGTAGTIRDEIIRTLKKYEPRTFIDECIVEPNMESNGLTYDLTFSFKSC